MENQRGEKAMLDQIPRWKFWRSAERIALQTQRDKTLKKEEENRKKKKEHLKDVHEAFNQTLDTPKPKPNEKQLEEVQRKINEAYTQMLQEQEEKEKQKHQPIINRNVSSQEKSFPKQEETTPAKVFQEIDQLEKELKKVSWWKVTEKALISRRIQAKELQLHRLQSEPKKPHRQPVSKFEEEERTLRKLTDSRNALSGIKRAEVSQKVNAVYNRLQERKREQQTKK